MDFIDQIKQFSKRVESLKDGLATEEATKTAIVLPFFSLLGYDVFNPLEFVPEYTADVGIKKGEKVDYAIILDGEPAILVECKWVGEPLGKHDSQLFRYFATSKAKFAILTNGLIFKFYTDLDEPNKMDDAPFLEINILDIKELQINELKKFCKSQFNIIEIFDAASDLKYSNSFKKAFAAQLQQPTDDLVKIFLTGVYDGRLTQTTIEKFRPVLKKSLNNYISELMSDKLKVALGNETAEMQEIKSEITEPVESQNTNENKIITTEEELEGYFLIKNVLKKYCDVNDITYKDGAVARVKNSSSSPL